MAQVKNILTPDLGGATDVTVIEILVKPGDVITADMPIVTLESDKATMEIPSTDSGTVKELKVKVGDKLSTGSVILTLASEGVAIEKVAEQVEKPKAEKPKRSRTKKPAEAAVEDDSDEPEVEVLVGTVQTDNDVHHDRNFWFGVGGRLRLAGVVVLEERRFADRRTGNQQAKDVPQQADERPRQQDGVEHLGLNDPRPEFAHAPCGKNDQQQPECQCGIEH